MHHTIGHCWKIALENVWLSAWAHLFVAKSCPAARSLRLLAIGDSSDDVLDQKRPHAWAWAMQLAAACGDVGPKAKASNLAVRCRF